MAALRLGGEIDLGQHLVDAAGLGLATSRRGGCRVAMACGLHREGDVRAHVEALEQPRDLERPCQPAPRPLVRRKMGDVVAGEDDPAAVGPHLAGELRHQRRLAGAVRADQRVHFAGMHSQVDAGARDHAAEALGKLLHVEQRLGGGCGGAHRLRALRSASQPARPWRANSTTASRTQPVQNSQCVV